MSAYIYRRVFERVQIYETVKLSEYFTSLPLHPDFAKMVQNYSNRRPTTYLRTARRSCSLVYPPLTIDICKADEADLEVIRYFYPLSVRARKGSPNVNDKYFCHYLIPISKTQDSVDSLLISNKIYGLLPNDTGAWYQVPKDRYYYEGASCQFRERRTHCVRVALDKAMRSFERQDVTHVPHGTPVEDIEVV
jgi:hypothetical protein